MLDERAELAIRGLLVSDRPDVEVLGQAQRRVLVAVGCIRHEGTDSPHVVPGVSDHSAKAIVVGAPPRTLNDLPPT